MKPLIVSLTSIPSRFDQLEPVLERLLNQSAKVEEVRLYLPKRYRRFPEYDGSTPAVPRGVSVIRPDEDLGPASKVLFAAHELRGTDCDLMFCDDDRLYDHDWFERMLAQRTGHENEALVTCSTPMQRWGYKARSTRRPQVVRGKEAGLRWGRLLRRQIQLWREGPDAPRPEVPRYVKSGFVEVFQGLGAVLVRPDFFDDEVYDIPPVLWSVDDFWLSGHLARRGIPIWCLAGFEMPTRSIGSGKDPLLFAVIDGANRYDANVACIEYMRKTYGVWF